MALLASCVGLACETNEDRASQDQDGGTDEADAAASVETGPSSCPGTAVGRSNADEPRALLPWSLELPDAGGPPPVDAGDTPATSGCLPTHPPGGSGTRCAGTASVSGTPDNPRLLLDDGAALQWAGARVELAARVEVPALPASGTVWLDYDRVVRYSSWSGDSQDDSLVVRASEGGEILFMGREGHGQEDMDAALVDELFGLTATAQPQDCVFRYSVGCLEVTRTQLDHLLHSTPPVTLQHATKEHIAAPRGEFDVVWAHTEEVVVMIQGCADGPMATTDTGFAVSRTRIQD